MLNQFLYDVGEAGEAGDQYIGLDRFGRVVDLLWQNGNDDPLDHFKYGYDRDGNRLYRTNEIDHDFDELYQPSGMLEDGGLDPAGQPEDQRYDRLNQLTTFLRGPLSDSDSDGLMDTVTTSARSQSWTMDGLGNFSSVTTDSTTLNRTHDLQNRLTGMDSTPLTYDDNGNLLTDDQGNEYTYDAWNRIVGVGEDEHHYAYDALGRRVREGDHTLYYSANWQVLEERDANDDVVYQYVWSPVYVDAMVARLTYPAGESMQSMSTIRDLQALEGIESSLMQMSFTNEPVEILYVLQDANFNVTSLVDATIGEVVERFIYDPYGQFNVLEQDWDPLSGSNYAWIYLHQGSRWDDAADLFNFRNRDYSPKLMRWVEQDPIGLGAGDSNFFRYLFGRPINLLDPLGLAAEVYESKMVAKSFINGLPRIGAFPGVGPQIIQMPGLNGVQYPVDVGPNARLVLLAAQLSILPAFNQRPTSDAKDGAYRLYTELRLKFSCCGDKPKVISATADMEGGLEIWPIWGTISMGGPGFRGNPVVTVQGSKVIAQWTGWGRPAGIFEPAMQSVMARTSVHIWHSATVTFECNEKSQAVIRNGNIGGSRFPSHQLWIDGSTMDYIEQGSLSDLWTPMAGNPTFVA